MQQQPRRGGGALAATLVLAGCGLSPSTGYSPDVVRLETPSEFPEALPSVAAMAPSASEGVATSTSPVTSNGAQPPDIALTSGAPAGSALAVPGVAPAVTAPAAWLGVTPGEPFAPRLDGAIVRRISIRRRNIFSEREEPQWLFGLFNDLHVTTREHVIAHELLLETGDVYNAELAEESERILRRLDFIADARVYPVALDDGSVELRVETRDRFTLRAGGSVGVFGGTSSGRATLGDSNLLGLGKELTLKFRRNDGDDRVGVGFEDQQLLGSHHILRASVDKSQEGDNVRLSVTRPFRTLETRHSYGFSAFHSERDVDYFEFGEDFAAVPLETEGLNAFYGHGSGPRENRLKLGARASWTDIRYDPAEGDRPDEIFVPGDTTVFEIGPTFAWDVLPEFSKKTHLDSFEIIEDIALGWVVQGFVGLHRRDVDGSSVQNELAVNVRTTLAQELAQHHLVTLSVGSNMRYASGSTRGWAGTGSVHYYYQGLPHQTLAASVTVDGVRETEGLKPQLLLGEDSGLRGYSARFFSGDRRLRINLEDRLFPEWELLSVQFGTVVFFDAGMAWDRGTSPRFSDLHRSVGLGLRVGSPELIRNDVVRLDLAFPLDDHPEEDFGVSLSVSVGQIFDVFGNAEGLDREF